MRWPWRKNDQRVSEATKAREQAEVELKRVQEETKEYAALGESLRNEIRGRNHLTELFLSIHNGGG